MRLGGWVGRFNSAVEERNPGDVCGLPSGEIFSFDVHLNIYRNVYWITLVSLTQDSSQDLKTEVTQTQRRSPTTMMYWMELISTN